jgi:hypothetical protein
MHFREWKFSGESTYKVAEWQCMGSMRGQTWRRGLRPIAPGGQPPDDEQGNGSYEPLNAEG